MTAPATAGPDSSGQRDAAASVTGRRPPGGRRALPGRGGVRYPAAAGSPTRHAGPSGARHRIAAGHRAPSIATPVRQPGADQVSRGTPPAAAHADRHRPAGHAPAVHRRRRPPADAVLVVVMLALLAGLVALAVVVIGMAEHRAPRLAPAALAAGPAVLAAGPAVLAAP